MARLTANEAALQGYTHHHILSYNDFTETTNDTAQTVNCMEIPAWCHVEKADYYIEELWDGTLTFTLGDSNDVDGYIQATDPTDGSQLTADTRGVYLSRSAALLATRSTGGVTDSDAAAADADAQLYVVPESDGVYAHFESTTAGNATVWATAGNGGPQYQITDNDTPGGVLVFFDEDAAATDRRFLANNASGKTVYVPTSTGELIAVGYSATPGTPGVQVYVDDDASNVYEKLLFVSPTDTDGTFTLDDAIDPRAGATFRNIQWKEYLNTANTLTATFTPSGGTALADSTQGRIHVFARIVEHSLPAGP